MGNAHGAEIRASFRHYALSLSSLARLRFPNPLKGLAAWQDHIRATVQYNRTIVAFSLRTTRTKNATDDERLRRQWATLVGRAGVFRFIVLAPGRSEEDMERDGKAESGWAFATCPQSAERN